MDVDIMGQPGAAAARVRLASGETLVAEVGAMIAMSPELQVETTSRSRGKGGILKGIKRLFSGESFFLNHFTASADGQEILVGPKLCGDIVRHRLDGGSIVVQGSSWLGATGEIDIDTTWQGFGSAFFSKEGIFWVKCSGIGDVLLNSFGAIYEIDVSREGYTVDNGHIVAFDDTLQFKMGKAGRSLIGSLLGGEGLVCKFQGQGKLYCQTHNPTAIGRLLGPMLKPRRG